MTTPRQRFQTCQKFLTGLLPTFFLLACLTGCGQLPTDGTPPVSPPNPENFPIVFDDTLAKSIPHRPGQGDQTGQDVREITGKDAVAVLKAAGRSIPCGQCDRIADPTHPNRREVVQEDGYIQVPDGSHQGICTYHYHDAAREVCCYWADQGESGYAWMGLDGRQRYLPKQRLTKPAANCREERAIPSLF